MVGRGITFHSEIDFNFWPAALVVSAGSSGYTDLVFGVQWSWTESGERFEQLQGLADCVSRRLDQGKRIKISPQWISPPGGRKKPLCRINMYLFFLNKKGRELNDDVIVDYASQCAAAAQSLAGSSPVSADEPKSTGDIKLVASAVGEWLRPLARHRHGWVALKRVRLECSCHSAGSKGSPSSPKSGPIIKPCANLRPPSQRRKVDFHYYH